MPSRCRRAARIFTVGRCGDFRVALKVIRIGRGVDAPSREPQYVPSMRVRAVIDRWGDGAVALAFAIWTQIDLWKHAPATMHVVGGRGVLSVLLVLVTFPLAARRRTPAGTLLTAAAALVLGAFLASHSKGVRSGSSCPCCSPSIRSARTATTAALLSSELLRWP
jgi:hypothetical protein